jgi:endonuclease/exonuclease/phosphatase family metal-dependent hydrolase
VAEPLIVTRTTPDLSALDAAARELILARPATVEEHARQFAACACLHEIEIAAPPDAGPPLAGPARVVFWNAERGKFLDASAALLGRLGAAACLLCELDLGMVRSGQAHTARELAARLGAGYVFGAEFVELGLGDAWERERHAGEINAAGLHGAAILSPYPLERPALVRLPPDGAWFDGTRGERRVGDRIALLATMRIDGRPVTLADVHLESHSDPASRSAQMALLLEAIDAYGGEQPVLLGGDFNTSTASRGWARGTGEREVLPAARLLDPVPHEPLFALAAAKGYDWTACNTLGIPTQRTRPDGTPPPPFGRIDWFFTRGLVASDPQTIPAVDAKGIAISDHEMLLVSVRPH